MIGIGVSIGFVEKHFLDAVEKTVRKSRLADLELVKFNLKTDIYWPLAKIFKDIVLFSIAAQIVCSNAKIDSYYMPVNLLVSTNKQVPLLFYPF